MTEAKSAPDYPKFTTADPRVLKPNPWNTNIMTPDNEAKLEASMKRFGVFRPAIVREIKISGISELVLQILGGQHRVDIAARRGDKEFPIVNLGPIDDDAAKEIGMVDNARYGVDDALALGELLKGMAHADQLSDFLPYTQNEFDSFIANSEIDLDALDFEENFDRDAENDISPEPDAPKPAKTHTILRFKLANLDAENVTALIERTKAGQGFVGSDELTNAGDALAHLLLNSTAAGSSDLEDYDAGDDA